MSAAIAKNLMAEMKLLGMFAAYDQGRFTVRAKAIT
jgi:hypothetical protein